MLEFDEITILKNRVSELEIKLHELKDNEQLFEEIRKLKRAVESSGEVIFITDFNGVITYINPEFTKVYGYNSLEVIGKATPNILKCGMMKPESYKYFWDTILNKQIAKGEFINKTKDGRLVNIEGSANAILNNKNEIIGFLAIQRDITNRKQADELLFESEARYRQLVQELPDSIVIYIDGKIVYVNSECLKLMHASSEDELIGRSPIDFVHPDYRALVNERMAKAFKERTSLPLIEQKYVTLDGSFVDVEVKATPIIYNKKPAVQVLLHDITKRKQAEIKLQESEEFLKETQFIANLGTFTLDVATGKWRSSEVLDIIFGIGSNYEKSVEGWVSIIHQEWQKTMSDYFIQEIIGNKKDFDKEYKIVRQNDKEVRWVHGVAKLKFNENNQPISLVGTIRDITEYKKIEEELIESNQFNKQIIQSAREGIIVYDKNMKFKAWNPFMEELTGLPASKVLGKYPFDLFPFLKDAGVIKIIQRSLNGEIIRNIDFDYNIPVTGKSGWVSDSTAPLLNAKGEIIGVIRTVHEITQRKLVEFELIKAKKRAEESDQLKSAFLANMSHEIRTPMNGITGFAQLISRPNISEEKRKNFSNIIIECCDQLAVIINNIIDVSKIETGQMELIMETTNLGTLMKDLNTLFNVKANEKGISLQISSDWNDKELIILTDKYKLQQILNNLIGNAIKFTKDGYVRFGYSIKGSLLEFYVEDSGIGIESEYHDKIFERFRQVELGISRSYEGAGLGLSIASKLVQLLGGEIKMNSTPGKGSTFFFTIPFIPSADNLPNGNNDSDNCEYIPDHITILIVEDYLVNFLFIDAIFSDYGYTILHATNGVEAIELCKSYENIDIILMDIKMPVMDGYEAAKQIRIIRPNIPIVAQTAFAMLEDKEKIEQSGFDGYITKPIRRNELIEMVQKTIRKKKTNEKTPCN